MKVWVTRDEGGERKFDISVWHSYIKPEFGGCGEWVCERDAIWCYTAKGFKDDLGFTPRKGSCKKYELTLKETK